MQFEYFSLTDIGRVRLNNEDAVIVDSEHGLVVLADGMGGYQAGEVASGLAVNMISGEMARWIAHSGAGADVAQVRRAIEVCADNANRAIYDAAYANAAYAGMGTTLVMLVVHKGKVITAHAGDSRAYLWRSSALKQITRDHSFLQEQIDNGFITPQEAALSCHRNLVTRALGVEEFVLLDLNDLDIESGDVYLLCSDGLTEMLDDTAIAAVLGNSALTLSQQADTLIRQANAQGGHDNISVALIRAGKPVVDKRGSGVIAKLLGK